MKILFSYYENHCKQFCTFDFLQTHKDLQSMHQLRPRTYKIFLLVSAPFQFPNVTSININSNYLRNYLDSVTRGKTKRAEVPDIELVLGISALTGDTSGSYRGLLGLTNEFYKEVFTGYEGFDAFSIVPVLLQPKSRGRVTLRSCDPLDRPIFEINYYNHEDDLATMVRGIKKVVTFGDNVYLNLVIVRLLCFTIASWLGEIERNNVGS